MLELKKITPHSLRYAFAVHLLERGVNFKHIQVLLGHADIRATARYARVADVRKIGVTSPLDALLMGVIK